MRPVKDKKDYLRFFDVRRRGILIDAEYIVVVHAVRHGVHLLLTNYRPLRQLYVDLGTIYKGKEYKKAIRLTTLILSLNSY